MPWARRSKLRYYPHLTSIKLRDCPYLSSVKLRYYPHLRSVKLRDYWALGFLVTRDPLSGLFRENVFMVLGINVTESPAEALKTIKISVAAQGPVIDDKQIE